jgi:transcriptional regulator with XRE-family HTH domain
MMAQEEDHPSEHEADWRARTIVQLLMTGHGVDAPKLAGILRLSRPAVTLKLRGHRRFTVAELFELARYFEVDPAIFFEDPKKLLGGSSIIRWYSGTPRREAA